MQNVFHEYEGHIGTSLREVPGTSDGQEESDDGLDIARHCFKKRKTTKDNELARYLKEEVAIFKEDVLEWWKVPSISRCFYEFLCL